MTFPLPCHLLGCSLIAVSRLRRKWRIPPLCWLDYSYLNNDKCLCHRLGRKVLHRHPYSIFTLSIYESGGKIFVLSSESSKFSGLVPLLATPLYMTMIFRNTELWYILSNCSNLDIFDFWASPYHLQGNLLMV